MLIAIMENFIVSAFLKQDFNSDVDWTLAETALQLSNYIVRIFGRSHQAVSLQEKPVTEKTKTKLSLEKYLGVLVFEVFVFEILTFEVLVFEVIDLRFRHTH